MFSHYFLSAWRNLLRHKAQSAINIFGLATGIASCLLIYLYVSSEQRYDRQFSDGDRIYRLTSNLNLAGQKDRIARNSLKPAQELHAMFPEIESYLRFMILGRQTIWYEDKMFNEKEIAFADSTFFQFFDFKVLAGDQKTCLIAPQSLILSETKAIKYFGSVNNAIGKVLKFQKNVYNVTAVFRREGETHLPYEFILSMKTVEPSANYQQGMTDYFYMLGDTYLKLRPGVTQAALAAKLPIFYEKNIKPWTTQNQIDGGITYNLVPLYNIHLDNSYQYDYKTIGNKQYVYIFAIVGIFILLIACVNYMNLTTAKASNRAKEVGMRKVAGASRGQLVVQLLGETLLLTLFAFVVALGLVEILIPYFNYLTDKELSFGHLFSIQNILLSVAFIITISLVAGSYPALYLTRFNPSEVLKIGVAARAHARGLLTPASLRKVLVVLQFAISVALITGTLVVFQQLHFMKNKDLGFDKSQTYVIEVPQANTPDMARRVRVWRDELVKMPGVASASFSENVPGGVYGELYFLVEQGGGRVNKFLGFTWMDEHYLGQMGIPMVDGRNFSREIQSDTADFVINQTCARFLGWDQPIGKQMENGLGQKGKVIGVVKDYHVSSLHAQIKPLVMMYTPHAGRNLLIKLKSGSDIRKTVSAIDVSWKNFDPTHPMESFFLDEAFDLNYAKEDKMLKVFGYFSLLAILISCLGLFGLAAYTTEQRTKEIGVRKVLGASEINIASLITRDFVVLVLVAVVLAVPVAWMLLRRWLEDFAFHIELSWGYFAAGSLAALLVALLTVSAIALRAAARNPVLSLRYE